MKELRKLAKKRAGHTCQNCNKEDKIHYHGWIEGFVAGYLARKEEIDGPEYQPKDIVKLRKEKGMSQRAFAIFLGVGEASVKRWESGYKMNRSTAKLVQEKCAP